MSPTYAKLSSTIYNFEGSISPAEVTVLVTDPDLQILQTSSPADPSTWDLLNNEFFAARPDVKLRLYGFYFGVCDLSILLRMGNVRHFAVDNVMAATGLEYLSHLSQLESLNIGIYDLKSFEFLASLPCEQIQSLTLLATESKSPDLRHVDRFSNLKKLYIEGHKKNIEKVGNLQQLEDLTIRSVTVSDISFIRSLSKLWSLDIKLGGSRDLSGIAGMDQIKYLELWQIKGLSDISVISTLPGLQFLFLQTLVHILQLPDLSQLTKLRRVVCENMSPSLDLSYLAFAPALQEFFYSTNNGPPADSLEWIAKLSSIKNASITLGRNKDNDRIQELLEAHNVRPYRFTPFVYD